MGFTRHERLDVKKPGPAAAPPPNSINPIMHASNKEILPENLRNGFAIAKKEVLEHPGDENHAPHSVDTEFSHVIIKNP